MDNKLLRERTMSSVDYCYKILLDLAEEFIEEKDPSFVQKRPENI
jgi:hypothetical protein